MRPILSYLADDQQKSTSHCNNDGSVALTY